MKFSQVQNVVTNVALVILLILTHNIVIVAHGYALGICL